jgi:hypothetical protein
MPNSKHLTHGISNLVSLITKTKLGLSAANKQPDALISLATTCQVTSRDDLEPLKRDQMRQVQPDWT